MQTIFKEKTPMPLFDSNPNINRGSGNVVLFLELRLIRAQYNTIYSNKDGVH